MGWCPASLNGEETNWYKQVGMIIISKKYILPVALQTIIFALKWFVPYYPTVLRHD